MGKKLIKPLKPSLREKKRYLVFEIISKHKFAAQHASQALNTAFTQFMGALGMAGAGIIFLQDKYKQNKGIFRVNHLHLDHARAGLTFINEIDGHAVTVRSVGSSGILKKALSKYMEV
jgi:ribonuclease P/MRP protein subunit POP5